MRSTCVSSLHCVFLWAISSQALALSWSGNLPILRHNPSTGSLSFTNSITVDESYGITPAISIFSYSGKFLPFPGHPGLVAYSSGSSTSLAFTTVPVGTFNLGLIVEPGTPTNDLDITVLIGIVYDTPVEPDDPFYPPPRALFYSGQVVSMPEPGTWSIAAMAVLGLASFRRRR